MNRDWMSSADRLCWILAHAVLIAASLVGCGSRTADDDESAWSFSDASLPRPADAGAGDARVARPDGALRDATAGTVRDARPTDPGSADARVVDARVLDARVVDAGVVDARLPPRPDGGRVPVDAGPRVVTALRVGPSDMTAIVGTVIVLNVTASYSDGTTADVSATALFTSSDEAVVRLAGRVATARAAGKAVVTVTFEGLVATAVLAVQPMATPVSITISSAGSCWAGQNLSLRAVATLSDGSRQDVTYNARWGTSGPTATVITAGLVSCIAPGTGLITATLGDVRGELTLLVNGPRVSRYDVDSAAVVRVGEGAYFELRVTYEDGSAANAGGVVWDSSNSAVLRPNAGSGGAFVGAAAGYAVVTAKLGDVAVASAKVAVTAGTLQSVVITPANLAITAPAKGALAVTGTYSDGIVGDISARVSWFTDVPLVDVSSGVVTPLGAGTVQVQARPDEGSLVGTAQITVAAGMPTRLEGPGDVSAPVGISRAVTAYATYVDGSSLDVTRAVTWVVADPSVAVFGGTLAVGLKAGSTLYYATLGNLKSDPAAVTITNATLLSIEFVATHVGVAVGDTYDMAINGTFDDGSQEDVTASATFTTGNASIATIGVAPGSHGALKGIAAGTTSVSATMGGAATSTTVTVYP
jgi:hypothetical protein